MTLMMVVVVMMMMVLIMIMIVFKTRIAALAHHTGREKHDMSEACRTN